jgi:D-alanine-D-alanine ligase
MHERWDEILVQRFIAGREVNVGIVGQTVLPISEIRFDGLPRGMWRIVSYRSKWETGSDEDLGAVPQCPAELDEPLAAEIERIALAAWRAVGGEGYGRVDMRIDRTGRPWILEVNANPDLASDAGLARMSRIAERDYADLVRDICRLGLLPTGNATSTATRWALAQSLSGLQHLTGTDPN